MMEVLLRSYATAQKHLPPQITLRQRGVMCFQLGFRTRGRWPTVVEVQNAARLWSDVRCKPLKAAQRELLLFLTGAALAAPSRQHQLHLLEEAYVLARTAWTLSPWQPWLGPAPQYRPRSPHDHSAWSVTTTSDPSGDPSGDPEPEQAPLEWEPTEERNFSRVGEILDGLSPWQAAVQDIMQIDLGELRCHGRPALAALLAALPRWEREGWHPHDQGLLTPFVSTLKMVA